MLKRLLLFIYFSCILSACYSQEVKTINLTSPGRIALQLSQNEQEGITELTLTGIIDARDLALISINMVNLKVLNLENVFIAQYSGSTAPQSKAEIHNENRIPNKAFAYKRSLETIILPKDLTVIGDEAFAGCVNLKSIDLPETLEIIEAGTFRGCISLTSIKIPQNTIQIKEQAFQLCSQLTNISFNNQLQSIKKEAFAGCTSLESVRLPETLTYIGESAFGGCKNLKDIFVSSPTPIIFPETDRPLYIGSKNVTLHVPSNSVDAYKKALEWKSFKRIRPL